MNGKDSARVAFGISPIGWLGGRNYQRNLLAALNSMDSRPITPVLFTGQNDATVAKDFPDAETVRSSILDRKTPAWLARKLIAKSTRQDFVLGSLLRRNDISVVSHSYQLNFHPDRRSGIRTIGWIPDFQHLHLPEFFSAKERDSRNRQFRSTCKHCDVVILSSECARADLQSFLPEYASKAALLRFVATPASLMDAPSLEYLQRFYQFCGPYFLLPNQFWAHKNHRVVINALRELKLEGRPLLVLTTGSPDDYRDPSFFPSLMQHAEKCDVLDCFRILGQIPYSHLVGLMRFTIGFINPSKFEGWSTSVEEAKSMGKQIVLSDLPVHREQNPERAFYFPADDAEALAAAMKSTVLAFEPARDVELQEIARKSFPERQREFGESYRRIVDRVLGRTS